ncbi:unnamed protein product [Rotaria sp. Silwood2]|nr:unnamed protein product [Rotaria sp. Silwood2]
MGFFLQDLHNSIVELHAQQFTEHTHMSPYTVYRGQELSQTHFDQMTRIQGGVLSFNNFLSTSLDQELYLAFAQSNQNYPDLIGVLFEITINPSTSTTPFTNMHGVSSFKDEPKILFSMHSIFPIGFVKQIDGNNRLWQVDLTLTSGNDADLVAPTEQVCKKTDPDAEGWKRLGMLLTKLENFDTAQALYSVFLDQTMPDYEKAYT